MEYRCLLTGNSTGSRTCGEYEPDGTIARPECRAPNYYYTGVLPYMRCIEGSWDYIARCFPGLKDRSHKETDIYISDYIEIHVSGFEISIKDDTVTIEKSNRKPTPNPDITCTTQGTTIRPIKNWLNKLLNEIPHKNTNKDTSHQVFNPNVEHTTKSQSMENNKPVETPTDPNIHPNQFILKNKSKQVYPNTKTNLNKPPKPRLRVLGLPSKEEVEFDSNDFYQVAPVTPADNPFEGQVTPVTPEWDYEYTTNF